MSGSSEALRYPAGRFSAPTEAPALDVRASAVAEIAAFPAALRAATEHLGAEALATPYRAGGWTVRQTVHHVADSHAHALLRFKWALTEDDPAIRPYDEAAWAHLGDVALPVETSLVLTEALHARWSAVMDAMTSEDWARRYLHPDNGPTRLDHAALLYAWHGRHHLAHIALVTD